MPHPTPSFAAPQHSEATTPPNYWAGLLLNIFLPGAGFTLLGLWQKHVAWALGLLLASLICFGLMVMVGSGWPTLVSAVLFVWMLVSYHQTYQRLAENNSWPPITSNLRLGMILGHVLLGGVGFFLFGILAAVVIPNVLAARERALEPQYAQAIYEQVEAEGVPAQLPAYCPPLYLDDKNLSSLEDRVENCNVLPYGAGGFQVQVDFRGGRSYSAHE